MSKQGIQLWKEIKKGFLQIGGSFLPKQEVFGFGLSVIFLLLSVLFLLH